MTQGCHLSIGIPTYNGALSLGATLDNILAQLPEGVEVVVSDNASTDATAELVRGYQNRAPALKHFRNETNVGYDRNVDAVVRRATGRFVWLLADDDLLRPGAVDRVLRVAREHPEVCEIYVDSLRPYTVLDEDVLCESGSEFLRHTLFRFGGLSSNVVNKAAWEATDLAPVYDSGWIHAAFVFANVGRKPSYLCRESLKFENPDQSAKRWGENGDFFRTGQRWAKVALQTMRVPEFSANDIRRALKTHEAGYFHAIPSAKAKGLRLDAGLLQDSIRLFGRFPSFWLIDLPLLLIPGFIFRLCNGLYRFQAVKNLYQRWRPLDPMEKLAKAVPVDLSRMT